MKFVGAHVSTEGGVAEAPVRANEIGARAFAIFTGWSSRWKSPLPKPETVELFRKRCEEFGYTPDVILPHSNFLINLGNPDAAKQLQSLESFIGELQRCEALGLKMLNFHPGSHLKGFEDPKQCLQIIAENINKALDVTEGVTAVLEIQPEWARIWAMSLNILPISLTGLKTKVASEYASIPPMLSAQVMIFLPKKDITKPGATLTG